MIIDCKSMANRIMQEAKDQIEQTPGARLTLAVCVVDADDSARSYLATKRRVCQFAGIRLDVYELPFSASGRELIDLVKRLNADAGVTGIMIETPLPPHIDAGSVYAALRPDKDVDGVTAQNAGLLSLGARSLVPCTAWAVLEILTRAGAELSGADCVIVGRSNTVGKPAAQLLLAQNATVTVCHSKTRNLPEIARRADVLVAAVGRAAFIGAECVKPGAAVIDVGINYVDGKLRGDVDFEAVKDIAGMITTVPGGVGVVTGALLAQNCYKAYMMQKEWA